LALAAASVGDTIELCADTAGGSKTFAETNIKTILDNLTIRARSGDTITWDGSGGEYCLMLSDGLGTPGEGNYSAADGVTIQNIIFTGTVQEFLVGTGWPYPGGANSTTITGCTFTGTAPSGGDAHGWGIVLAVLSNDFTFTGNTLSNNTDNWGVHFWKGNRFTISNNTFSGGTYEYSAIGIDAQASGETVNSGATDTGVISGNTFINVQDSGSYYADRHVIGLHGGTNDSRPIKRVKISGNTVTSCGLKGGSALGGYNAEDYEILNNTMYNNDYFECIAIGTNSKTVKVVGNKIYGNRAIADYKDSENKSVISINQASGGCATCKEMDDIIIAHNTIADNDDLNSPTYTRNDLCLLVVNDAAHSLTNITIKNNIFYKNSESTGTIGYAFLTDLSGAATISGIDIDYNSWFRSSNNRIWNYNGTGYSLSQIGDYRTASSQEAHSINTDPLLQTDLRLSNNSPAKDTGTPVFTYAEMVEMGLIVYGTAPDIGGSERVQMIDNFPVFDLAKSQVYLAAPSTSSSAYVQPGRGDTWQGVNMTWQGESVTW
jgi:parallel beta-helix repeat protein